MTDPTPPRRRSGPVLIDLDPGTSAASPAEAAPVPDAAEDPAPKGQAMQTLATLGARRRSGLGRWVWGLVLALLGIALSVTAWDFATGLIARVPLLGYAVTVLMAMLVLVLSMVTLRELSAFSRLKRIDILHLDADAALSDQDLGRARKVVDGMAALYAGRDDTSWGRDRLAERRGDMLDADALLALAETEVLAPLDIAATREVEAAARQVATVTAIVPLALADVFAALTSNMRMIRRIAEIYGGRSGTLGSLRLLRAVLTHLVATGAVAVGDDMLGSVAGGSILSKLSRRFGEGIVNGALTARVGVAAMEVCRPLPFRARPRPSVSALVGRALRGLFGST